MNSKDSIAPGPKADALDPVVGAHSPDPLNGRSPAALGEGSGARDGEGKHLAFVPVESLELDLRACEKTSRVPA